MAMRVWLINPYGPIPCEGWRDYRFTMIGKILAREGCLVTWWTSNFSHHFKRMRSTGWQDVPVCDGFQIRLVPTTPYRTNISVGRLRCEANFARNMLSKACECEVPDLLIAVDPPQIIGWLGTNLKTRFGVPLVLDVMDMWPELFQLAFPTLLKPLAQFFLFPFYALRRRNLTRADAVTALCETYMDVALREAPVLRKRLNAIIFNGIDISDFSQPISTITLPMAKLPGEIWAIYAGTLGNNYDVDTVLHAGLAMRGSKIWLLLAGDGPRRADVERFIKTYPSANLKYLGKLAHQDLIQLYQACDVGLCPYAPGSNVAMPDKAYDYMAAGLPLVSSLRGELERFLRRRGAGVQYQAGDAASLSDALRQLACDQQGRSAMAGCSRECAPEFDEERQYRKFVHLVGALEGTK